ncbi:MAG: methylenetetrahydrofolate reductase [Dehalococcoidia bacterium]
MTSLFSEKLSKNQFVITTELNPPKGTDLEPLISKALALRDSIDAFNLTDSHSAKMSMAPIAAAHKLKINNIESILQVACRDKNRISLQGDLLAAHALGIENILCMTGDNPKAGDHPDAKGVFDIDAVSLIKAASTLTSGYDLSGSKLSGSPSFCVGAVVNPSAQDLDSEIARLEQKMDSGAIFFQTQGIYDVKQFLRFMRRIEHTGAKVIAGVMVLKSAKMANFFNENLFGVSVPNKIIKELESSKNNRQTTSKITTEIIQEIKEACHGIHIMALGWEDLIPEILFESNINK